MFVSAIQSETNTSTTVFPTFSQPRLLLHLEGLALFIAAAAAYYALRGSGLLFIALLFVPDVSMLGYLGGTKLGALLYNLVHTYTVPAALLGLSLLAGWQTVTLVALIWLAHIGMDRTVGYGLKYADAFKHTHLNEV
jgi:hypothetical protein